MARTDPNGHWHRLDRGGCTPREAFRLICRCPNHPFGNIFMKNVSLLRSSLIFFYCVIYISRSEPGDQDWTVKFIEQPSLIVVYFLLNGSAFAYGSGPNSDNISNNPRVGSSILLFSTTKSGVTGFSRSPVFRWSHPMSPTGGALSNPAARKHYREAVVVRKAWLTGGAAAGNLSESNLRPNCPGWRLSTIDSTLYPYLGFED
jgi:hypothetical protein